MNQITIRKEMRESVEDFRDNKGARALVKFTGVNGNKYSIYDNSLEPEQQTVEIEKIMPSGTIMTFQMPSADFELLVDLMDLETRGIRKVEDI